MRSNTAVYKGVVLLVVVVPLLATAVAISLLWARAVQWSDLALLATLYALVAFGVTVGYHRMLTHRSFRPHPVVKGLLLILGSMAVEEEAQAGQGGTGDCQPASDAATALSADADGNCRGEELDDGADGYCQIPDASGRHWSAHVGGVAGNRERRGA